MVAAVLIGTAALLMARDAYAARDHLLAADGSFEELAVALRAGDATRADDAVRAAVEEIADARSRTSGPLWRIASWIPYAGRTPAMMDRLVGVAEASVAVGASASEHASDLLTVSGGGIEVSGGKLDLDSLGLARASLDEIPIDRLARTRDRLADADGSLVPGELVSAGRRAVRMADRILGTADSATELLDVLPGFLGSDEPRRYLLGIQTNAEVRGTGGLLGYVGMLRIDDGQMTLANEQVVDLIDEDEETVPVGQIGGRIPNPVSVPEEFADRYDDFTDASSFFAHVNVDPDLPTSAPIVLDLYERHTGQAADGLILLDPLGLREVLRPIGPVDVPESVVDRGGQLPVTVAPEDVPQVTMVDIYDVYGAGRSTERGAYFAALSRTAFQRVFGGDWDAIAMARRLGEASGGRHIQFYSRDDREQEVFETVGIAGGMPTTGDRDVFALTSNNAVGGKQDVHLGHTLDVDVELGEIVAGAAGPVAPRRMTANVQVDNPLPASGRDLYIIGNCSISEDVSDCFEGPPGWNRTWFTVWTRADSNPLGVRVDGEAVGFRSSEIHGLDATDHFLHTPPEGSASFEVGYDGGVPLETDGRDLVYELVLWRQARAIPDRLELSISPPPGWNLADVSVDGGGDGSGMGPFGEPGPEVSTSVERGQIRISGDVNRDLIVRLRLSRPAWDRLLDWLGTPAV